MSHRSVIRNIALLIAILVTVVTLSAGQDIKLDLKKPYAWASYETLSGRITFNGERPPPLGIDNSADPVCLELNPGLSTEYVVGDAGRLANVLIYVESETLQAYNFEQPTEAVVLEHKGCRYSPRVLGMRVGQPLVIPNRDATHHNTHPLTQKNVEWNLTQPPGTPPLVKTFTRPEKLVVFKCNQHPWEKAYVGIFDHPFFAVSDQQGNFKIEGLPPGQYKVVAWHERFGEKTVDITFLPGEARELTFDFTASER